MHTLVLASHNQGKLRELQALLSPLGFTVESAGDLGVSEPEETGLTFAANAELKALHSATATGKLALADDSGLSVPALDGAPGIYSARWAGAHKDFTVAMHRIARELHERGLEPEGQAAYFTCALALAWPSGDVQHVEGRVDGTLTFPPRGEKGFGYDPIFIPSGYTHTFAEMEPLAKEKISHRTRAFTALQTALAELLKEPA